MVAPVKARKVPMNGKQSFWLVPTVADLNAPKITEINAATGINLSCGLFKSFEGLRPTFSKVDLEEILCETETFGGLDNTKYEMADLVGQFDPQAAQASADKKAFEFLRNGFTGIAVFRNGIVANQTASEAAVGQFFNLVPVEISKAVDASSAQSASEIAKWTAGVAVTGAPVFNVAAVA